MKQKAYVFEVGEFFSGFFLYVNFIISKILHIYNERIHLTKGEEYESGRKN